MITAGLKLTHSGGLAVLDGDELLFNIEVQKLDNNARYSPVADMRLIPEILAGYGLKVSDVDQWAIDGWDGAQFGHLSLLNNGKPFELTVAPYRENGAVNNICRPGFAGEVEIGGQIRSYRSYVHVSSHFAAAYCSSPFAARGEDSFVLVWDGGCFPRLYYVDHRRGIVENGNEVFPLIGHSYAMAAQYFGPWRRAAVNRSQVVDDLSVAGKLMAYIGLGNSKDTIQEVFRRVFHKHFAAQTPTVVEYRKAIIGCGSNGEPSHRYVHAYLEEVQSQLAMLDVADEDVLASMHQFMEDMLVESLVAKVRAWKGDGPFNLSFAGGCALNIKWNTALRAHPIFNDVWVPPYPDDSGSAIGVACTERAQVEGLGPINWHVRLGPELLVSAGVPAGWTSSPCSLEDLARLLHATGRPVVFLRGRAELGPRALGARSIIAPAVSPGMKDHLNAIKHREGYRPVAPICRVENAREIFSPGSPDPYMLFDHFVRPAWLERIPAVVHVDGTARLQTVSVADDPALAELLRAYHELSGIPVLCNTSANLAGHGFFPDAQSAMNWGGVDYVWCDGVMYTKAS